MIGPTNSDRESLVKTVIWTPFGAYRRVEYQSESDLEQAIVQVQAKLFGSHRIYLDIKKKIGAKGGQRNIPDGYLIDLSSATPRLYVVENELAVHDPLRHIAVQILQFSLSYESEPRQIRTILFDALQALPDYKRQCQEYAVNYGYRNLDHLLDQMVYESPFAALVIIDEAPDDLQTILAKKFKFGVEILELSRFENGDGEHFYLFEPFLSDVDEDIEQAALSGGTQLGVEQLDTVVVPAHEDGFIETFLGENRWYAIRMHDTIRPQIRYLAIYRIRPTSAITHVAEVASIEPWKDTGKYVINFVGPAQEIHPIKYDKNGRVKALQNLRYTTLERLQTARTLDDLW